MSTPAALAPLKAPVFRGLGLAWLAANLAMWVNGRIRGEQHSTIRRINRRFPMVHPGS